jgi:hypothetical protein
MNQCLDYELQTELSHVQIERQPVYIAAAIFMILLWVVFSVMSTILLIAIFIPGHLGLTGLLQLLGRAFPADFPILTT